MESQSVSLTGEIIWTDEAVEQIAATFLDLAEEAVEVGDDDSPTILFPIAEGLADD